MTQTSAPDLHTPLQFIKGVGPHRAGQLERKGLRTVEDALHFVCPWHGYEYDMKTGECVSDRKLKLRRYKVVQKGDELYVIS